jgi:hypothetical protein
MGSQPRTKVVVTGDDLNDTRREELLSELTELEIAVGSEWRWLDDDGVTGEESRSDLAAGKMDGEVPGNDADDETKGSVADDNLLAVIFLNNLLLDLKLGQLSEPFDTSSGLTDGELDLDWSV